MHCKICKQSLFRMQLPYMTYLLFQVMLVYICDQQFNYLGLLTFPTAKLTVTDHLVKVCRHW